MHEPTIDDLIFRLKHDDADVRSNAAWLLGRKREFGVLPALTEAITDPDAGVRVRVAEALGGQKGLGDAATPLMHLLADTDADVRAQAARALGALRDPRAGDALVSALSDPDATVRAQAAEALGPLANPDHVAPLLERFLQDDDETTRFAAEQSLKQIGTDAAPSLIGLLATYQGHPGVLMRLIEVLAALGDPRAAEPVATLRDHSDEGVRATADWAYGLLMKGR